MAGGYRCRRIVKLAQDNGEKSATGGEEMNCIAKGFEAIILQVALPLPAEEACRRAMSSNINVDEVRRSTKINCIKRPWYREL